MYRQRLVAFLSEHQLREPVSECVICMEPLSLLKESPEGKPVMVLACCHCFHNTCWLRLCEGKESASCPTCRQPVQLFEGPGKGGAGGEKDASQP